MWDLYFLERSLRQGIFGSSLGDEEVSNTLSEWDGEIISVYDIDMKAFIAFHSIIAQEREMQPTSINSKLLPMLCFMIC